jgi:protease-4
MAFNTTISAILRGYWLIDKAWADAHWHLILKTMSGEPVDWGLPAERIEESGARADVPKRLTMMNSGDEVFKASHWMSPDRFPYNSIVMIDIIGPVLKYGDVCSYGSVHHSNLIAKFANAKNIAGIILNIDSPGGQADGTAMLAKTINQAVKLKPVVGIIQDGLAASAGYWIGSSTQELYCSEDTDKVGSIGAYTTIANVYAYWESQGLPVRDIYSRLSTDKSADYRNALEGKDDLIQDDLDFLVKDFIADVKTFRGQRLKTSKEDPFTGKMYHSADATKIGLIDGVKSLEQVVKRVQNLISLRQQNAA